jgi:hypothetical protein
VLVRAEVGRSRGRHGELGSVATMSGGEAALGAGSSNLGGRRTGEGLGHVAVANGRGKEALKRVLGWRAPGGRGGRQGRARRAGDARAWRARGEADGTGQGAWCTLVGRPLLARLGASGIAG